MAMEAVDHKRDAGNNLNGSYLVLDTRSKQFVRSGKACVFTGKSRDGVRKRCRQHFLNMGNVGEIAKSKFYASYPTVACLEMDKQGKHTPKLFKEHDPESRGTRSDVKFVYGPCFKAYTESDGYNPVGKTLVWTPDQVEKALKPRRYKGNWKNGVIETSLGYLFETAMDLLLVGDYRVSVNPNWESFNGLGF